MAAEGILLSGSLRLAGDPSKGSNSMLAHSLSFVSHNSNSSFWKYSLNSRILPCGSKSVRQRRAGTVPVAAVKSTEGLDPLLVRVARGEEAERAPVWLMRQAGRYMAAFREFSDKYPFRQRSETAEIAIELSLQPWQAFHTDGVIMFSDILTILPALGLDFDMVKGKGPIIFDPVRTMDDVRKLRPLDDAAAQLPFIGQILGSLRQEVGNSAAVLGFVGSPWTLAAYAMEGQGAKNLLVTKKLMYHSPEVVHALLQHLEDALVAYVIHQIDSGAQVVQVFDSWAHHLAPGEYKEFSLSYSERLLQRVKRERPSTPLILHANGGTGKLHLMDDSHGGSSADVIGIDWSTEMADARRIFGPQRVLQGNVDPLILLAPEDVIRQKVQECLQEGGGQHHILNVGHGIVQGTPEANVSLFCQAVRENSNRSSSSEGNGSCIAAAEEKLQGVSA